MIDADRDDLAPVPVNEPILDGREREYILECLETGWVSSDGPFVARFEEVFARKVGRRHGVALASGTAALEVAVAALGIRPGDEVILPTFTIISPAAAVIRAGATPVLVDADPITWNMDVRQIESRITSRTRAIIVVHIYGLPADMDPILEIAARHGLAVIEDAAEMHGQTYRRRPCGSFGDISTFSFYANKHVTTGEGGIAVTDDERLADHCRSLRNLCFEPGRRFVHRRLGWNYRLTNLQAAIGLAQLERLDEFVRRKRQIGSLYGELLSDAADLRLPPSATEYARNIYWVYGIVLTEKAEADATEMMRRLARRKIGTRPFFWPMHEQPVFQEAGLFRDEHYPVSSSLARRGFYLPSGLALSDRQIERSARELIAALRTGAAS